MERRLDCPKATEAGVEKGEKPWTKGRNKEKFPMVISEIPKAQNLSGEDDTAVF